MLRAKKNAKIKKNQSESGENLQMNSEKQRRTGSEAGVSAVGKNNQVIFSNPRFPIEAFCLSGSAKSKAKHIS